LKGGSCARAQGHVAERSGVMGPKKADEEESAGSPRGVMERALTVFNILPERMFGIDTDEILAFTTTKTVWIRDRELGLGYWIALVCIVVWILFGQILYRNEHFAHKDVQGLARIWYSHPTAKGCNANTEDCEASFRIASELDYCYENPDSTAAKKAKCTLADKRTLSPMGDIDNKVFLPTSVRWITEKQVCDLASEDHKTCTSEYEQVDDGEAMFYGDVENFVVQVVSSYQRDSISGTSLDHQGYTFECNEYPRPEFRDWKQRTAAKRRTRGERCGSKIQRNPIDCLPGEVCSRQESQLPEVLRSIVTSSSDAAPEAEALGDLNDLNKGRPSERQRKRRELEQHKLAEGRSNGLDMFADSWGDGFKLKKLLQLADIDLDLHHNAHGESVREAGTVIEIEAMYNNIYRIGSSFGYQPVEYTYRVSERIMPYLSSEYLAIEQPPDYPKTRRYAVQHGILIVFKVTGQFGFFNIVYFFLMLATSLAMVATAARVTDLISIYFAPRKRNYFHLKYDVSPDFSDCWECKCGFMNEKHVLRCMGHDLWTSAKDTALCGKQRPPDWKPPEDRPPLVAVKEEEV